MLWRRRKRICDGGLRIEETIYSSQDAVVFITPRGQVKMASSIKRITTPGFEESNIPMMDCAEVYELYDGTGMKHRELYSWVEFREVNKDLCEY